MKNPFAINNADLDEGERNERWRRHACKNTISRRWCVQPPRSWDVCKGYSDGRRMRIVGGGLGGKVVWGRYLHATRGDLGAPLSLCVSISPSHLPSLALSFFACWHRSLLLCWCLRESCILYEQWLSGKETCVCSSEKRVKVNDKRKKGISQHPWNDSTEMLSFQSLPESLSGHLDP